MNNNLMYPFERNRYYAGKMLTSADFGAEQTYMNDKRRFLNNLMFGSGIVCGCNVYSLDDLSVFVESGCAIDKLGREIVIETSVVKKLSAITGFDQIDNNKLTLCLKYAEENVHPVYSVKQQKGGNEYEYNRIKEGYELFLLDSDTIMSGFEMDNEFLSSGTLYRDDDYEVTIKFPATMCKGRYVCMVVTASKLSNENVPLNFATSIQMPSLTCADGSHEQRVEFDSLNLYEGETATRKYWVYVQNVAATECTLICNNELAADQNLSLKVMLSDIDPTELVDRELGKTSLEMHEMGGMQDYICLADISLLRTDSAYIIEHIEERHAKKYIETPAMGALRREYLNYFVESDLPGGEAVERVSVNDNFTPQYKDESSVKVATGTLEIPVGGKVKAGEVFYSGEIMHGLGNGTVYVEIGREFIEEEPVAGANTKSTVYGNSDLFREFENKAPQVETAIKVLNDKGSFIAAAKFPTDNECLMLTYRWVAFKLASNTLAGANTAASEQWIEAETPTAVLGERESYFFGVKFHNMDKCSITYEVTEEDGGKITSDGVYTAPGREGVYEIKISCVEMPFISTYAYAVVKKK